VHQVGNQPRLYYDAGQPIIKMIKLIVALHNSVKSA